MNILHSADSVVFYQVKLKPNMPSYRDQLQKWNFGSRYLAENEYRMRW